MAVTLPPTCACARPHTQMWAKAAATVDAHDCPRCERPAGQPCRNLRTAAWKAAEDLLLPHKERAEVAP